MRTTWCGGAPITSRGTYSGESDQSIDMWELNREKQDKPPAPAGPGRGSTITQQDQGRGRGRRGNGGN